MVEDIELNGVIGIARSVLEGVGNNVDVIAMTGKAALQGITNRQIILSRYWIFSPVADV